MFVKLGKQLEKQNYLNSKIKVILYHATRNHKKCYEKSLNSDVREMHDYTHVC